ncbi:MAG: redoxin domain-containing protein [Verrucomicrobiota bacterium]
MKNATKLFLSGLFALAITSSVFALETGAKAPDFTLNDTTGTMHNLSDFKGKYVVLEWTNHQCPFVKKFYSQGDMQSLQKEMTGDGVVWLQIVSSAEGKQGYVTAEAGESLRSANGHNSTAMLLDPSGEVGKTYSAKTTPHMFLIDPDGTLIYQGAIDSKKSTKAADIAGATNYVKAAYTSAKVGEPIEKPSTPPYGCSVKY